MVLELWRGASQAAELVNKPGPRRGPCAHVGPLSIVRGIAGSGSMWVPAGRAVAVSRCPGCHQRLHGARVPRQPPAPRRGHPRPWSKEVPQRSARGARRPADRRDGSVTIPKCSMNIACGSTYWSLRCRGTSTCSNRGRQEMQAGEEEFEISPSAASPRDWRAVREGTGLLAWFSPVLDSQP